MLRKPLLEYRSDVIRMIFVFLFICLNVNTRQIFQKLLYGKSCAHCIVLWYWWIHTTVFFEKDNKYSDNIYLDRSHKYFSKNTFQKFASIIKYSNLKYCNYKRKIFIFNYYYIIFKKNYFIRPQFQIKYLYIILNC